MVKKKTGPRSSTPRNAETTKASPNKLRPKNPKTTKATPNKVTANKTTGRNSTPQKPAPRREKEPPKTKQTQKAQRTRSTSPGRKPLLRGRRGEKSAERELPPQERPPKEIFRERSKDASALSSKSQKAKSATQEFGLLLSDKPKTAYLAPAGRLPLLLKELKAKVLGVFDELVVTEGEPEESAWAQNIWLDTKATQVSSVSSAASHLMAIQRNWRLYPVQEFRRSKLIESKLAHVSAKPFVFGSRVPAAALGSWTLLSPEILLYSAACSSPFPNGEVNFVEDKSGPPNRAYLKLWELFTRVQVFPHPKERVLDMGASPGGWSWVCAELGAYVRAIDRSPLAPALKKYPNIRFQSGDGLQARPEKEERVDWVLSDAALSPEKLLPWVQEWIQSGKTKKIVCTLKFTKDSNYSIIEKFRAIPRAEVFHLFHNKHELTFFWDRSRRE